MVKFLLTLWLVIHTAAALSPWSRGKRSVNTVFSWKTVAYGPMDRSEKELIGGYPFYIRKNIIPTAMAYHEKTSMLYIAAPRLKPGVVATLNSLDLYETFHLLSPIWSPYPNAQMNELKPWHYPDPDSAEYEEVDDCDEDWKKGPGFCKGYYADDHKHIPEKYLPDELLTESDSQRRRRRNKRSYNETNIKIQISPSFPMSYTEEGSPEDDGDSLRITLRTVRQLKSLISVNSLMVDKCDRLWFIDTGHLDYYNGSNLEEPPPITVQRPSIWVVDVSKRDLFLIHRRFEFDDQVVPTPAGLRGFSVDIPGECDSSSSVAYISNALDHRIVVYDMEKEDAWYFHDESMEPASGRATRLNFRGMRVHVHMGITDVAVGWRSSAMERSVYYVPYSSNDLFVVSTGRLTRQRSHGTSDGEFKYLGSRGAKSQAESITFDSNLGILFFAEVQTRTIKCWNVRKTLKRSNIGTVFENNNLDYPAHLSIDSDGNLWVLNNNFPTFLEQGFHHDVNYNIHLYRIVLKDIIKHTVCE